MEGMRMSNGITKANLMRAAPNVLVNDKNMNPLVNTLADALEKLAAKCRMATIYPRIDELPEDLLDILAQDFNVDWYDFNYDLETKRSVLRDSFFVHRHRGTVAALVTALNDLWPNSRVEEWFAYNGDPYHFQVYVTTPWSAETERLITETISRYKNIRSVLDGISFNVGEVDTEVLTGAAVCGVDIAVDAEMM
jgi:phage tail P2-like protein